MSESERLPEGKSDTELAIESLVDRMNEIYPDLDREEFHNAISGCVHDALEDKSDGGDEEE
jgi:hypothetical protein